MSQVSVACAVLAGCVLENGHKGGCVLDLSERARLALGAEPASVVLARVGSQLIEAGALLQEIARELGPAPIDGRACECGGGMVGFVCVVCGGRKAGV